MSTFSTDLGIEGLKAEADRLFARKRLLNFGLPALVLGPGDIAQAHAVDEWVALEQLGKAQALYAKVIKNDG